MKKRYYIKSLKDSPACTIRTNYRSALVEAGFTELDDVDDKELIDAYKAVGVQAEVERAIKIEKKTRELSKGDK